MSTARFNILQNAAGSKSVPVDTVVDGSAKAWVNFNGTGTVAIRQAFNVSSITDNGTGDYTINFATAMPDANYAAATVGGNAAGSGFDLYAPWLQPPTTTSFRVGVYNGNSSAASDCAFTQVAFFR